jgi:hypothetical protein
VKQTRNFVKEHAAGVGEASHVTRLRPGLARETGGEEVEVRDVLVRDVQYVARGRLAPEICNVDLASLGFDFRSKRAHAAERFKAQPKAADSCKQLTEAKERPSQRHCSCRRCHCSCRRSLAIAQLLGDAVRLVDYRGSLLLL